LARFGAPEVKIDVCYDRAYVNALSSLAYGDNLPAGTLGAKNTRLDHASVHSARIFISRNIPD
jgi:hypothetical protein